MNLIAIAPTGLPAHTVAALLLIGAWVAVFTLGILFILWAIRPTVKE